MTKIEEIDGKNANGNFIVNALDYKMSFDDKWNTSLDSPFVAQQLPTPFSNFPKNTLNNITSNTPNKSNPLQPLPFNLEKSLFREELPSPFLASFTPITNTNKGPTFDFLLSAAKKDVVRDGQEQGKAGGSSGRNFDFNFVLLPSPSLFSSRNKLTAGPVDSCNREGQYQSFTFDEAAIEGDSINQAYGDVIEKRVHKN